jgi:aminopeptidase N
MIALAETLGWLSPEARRAEIVAMMNDVLASGSMSFADVDLICSLNRDGELNGELSRVKYSQSRAPRAAQAAALACLGSSEAHAQVLGALASADDKDVQIAQVYLRNRPLSDMKELRELAKGVARMAGSGAQIRALDTLARLHISDREILEELARSFAQARSVGVQRAIAEVFIRSDPKAIAKPQLVGVLRQHRLRAPDGRQDLIDVLINRLQGS